MPLINGQKMACEPCIRGHRSTKCTHANERLMVPVRKPGRPLTQCAHPVNGSCSCGTVTAAIPKKQKCGCGTSSETQPSESKQEPKSESEPSTSGVSTPSETKQFSSTHRVQKSRRNTLSNKKAIAAADIERMDPSQLNILPAKGSIQQAPMPMPMGYMPSMEGVNQSQFGAVNAGPANANANGSFNAQPWMAPIYQQQHMSPLLHATTNGPGTHGYGSPVVNGLPPPVQKQSEGGCCAGGGGVDTNSTQAGPENAQHALNGARLDLPLKINGDQGMTAKGCCSAKSTGTNTPSNGNGTASTTLAPSSEQLAQAPNEMMMPPWAVPVVMPNGMYGFIPQHTIYYPPQYGTFMQPLQSDQWKQVMATPGFGNSVQPQPTGTGTGASDELLAGTLQQPSSSDGTSAKLPGTSHLCTCGDDCDCVGCAAHPYNDASKNYIRSAWNIMADETQQRSHYRDQIYPDPNNHSIGGLTNNNTSENVPQDTLPAVPNPVDSNTGTPAANTPGSLTEDQTLSPNDFFFVNYAFGDLCDGETASCPCGDDCQCIGCVIHNNTPKTTQN